jgi:HD-GYP domain-containing protein (c-di-GMP phosphodiesterase class II)
VADIAVELFREMGEDGDELSGRYYGALLHDLGKIAVPARILTKPGALSDDEWTIVREHPVIGAAVAKEIDFLEEQIPMMLFHHERIDGRGYPWGLGAEAIPLAARVLSVADVFDTLTSDRPYRRALSTDDAMIEIELSAGTQLDADVVAALRRVLKRTEFPARLSPDLPVAEPVAEPLAQGA